MHKFFILLIFSLSFTSCNDVDENVLPVVGIYRAHVFGLIGPFDLITSSYKSNKLKIEALFDGYEYNIAIAEISESNERTMDIEIDEQTISNNVTISGKGKYLDGTLELSYSLSENGKCKDFKIIGAKL